MRTAAAAAEQPEEKKKRGRPEGTTKAAQEQKRIDEEVFSKDNIRFYLEQLNNLLRNVALNCTDKELQHFVDPVHKVANKKLGDGKFFATDEGQLAFLAVATFAPKIPGAIKVIRGKFNRGSVRNVEDGKNASSERPGETTSAGDVPGPDGAILRRIDFPERERTSAIL